MLLSLLTIVIILSAVSGIVIYATETSTIVATQHIYEYEMEIGDRQSLLSGGIVLASGSITEFVLKSDNTDVATVSSAGRIKAIGYGTAVITATNEPNSLKFIFVVSVKKPAEKISIDQTDRVMFKGEAFRLTYSVPKGQRAGNVAWTSDNNSVATVGIDGIINAIGVGKAVITATSEYGASASYIVEVVEHDDRVTDVNVNAGDMSFDSSNYFVHGENLWTGGSKGSNSMTWISGGANASKGCIKIDVTSKDGDRYVQAYFGRNDVKPGDRYTFSCWVKIDSIEYGANASITVGSKTNGYLVTQSFTRITNGWEKVHFDFMAPAGVENCCFMLRMQGIGTVYYDEVRIIRQRDVTDLRFFSDGLALNSIVKNAPLSTANIHYVPKATGTSELITSVYDGGKLADVISTPVSATSTKPQTIEFPFNEIQIGKNQTVGIMNWRDVEGLEPLDQKKTFLEKTQRSDVYNFFEINRMRGVYGGISDIYSADVKTLITQKGINTLILNIIGKFYDKNILKDRVALDKVLTDAEALSEETGVKIIPKISYGSANSNDSTLNNTVYGEFHPGQELVNSAGQVIYRSYLPCPRARQYWKEMITDNLSVVATHKKLVGGVIDLEMYSGYRTSYAGPCKCDICAADFDRTYGTRVAQQTITQRAAYITDNNLAEKYNAWHKAEIIDIASEVRETLHKINPDFIIGYMPQIEWISGITQGLGTHNMPVMIFNEQEYKGDLSKMYVNQARIRLDDLPAVYATGLWSTKNTSSSYIASENFAAKAIEAARNSMGYWIYSSNYLVGTGNTAEENAEYVTAVKEANDAIDSKYGL